MFLSVYSYDLEITLKHLILIHLFVFVGFELVIEIFYEIFNQMSNTMENDESSLHKKTKSYLFRTANGLKELILFIQILILSLIVLSLSIVIFLI